MMGAGWGQASDWAGRVHPELCNHCRNRLGAVRSVRGSRRRCLWNSHPGSGNRVPGAAPVCMELFNRKSNELTPAVAASASFTAQRNWVNAWMVPVNPFPVFSCKRGNPCSSGFLSSAWISYEILSASETRSVRKPLAETVGHHRAEAHHCGVIFQVSVFQEAGTRHQQLHPFTEAVHSQGEGCPHRSILCKDDLMCQATHGDGPFPGVPGTIPVGYPVR